MAEKEYPDSYFIGEYKMETGRIIYHSSGTTVHLIASKVGIFKKRVSTFVFSSRSNFLNR